MIRHALLMALTLAASAHAQAPGERLDQALGEIQGEWTAANLSAWANVEGVNAFRIGEEMAFHFKAERDGYLTVIHRDSFGIAHVLVPSPLLPDSAIAANQTVTIEGLESVPPAGQDRLYAILTQEPLDAKALDLEAPPGEMRTFDSAPAIAFAELLAQTLGELAAGTYAIATIDYRVVGRGEIEYTVGDVVAQLTPTRSVPRPKLAFRQVTFATGSAELTPQARQNLDVIGQALLTQQLGRERFVLGGHTDDVGGDALNLTLSERRAESARAYLVERWGIPAERVDAKGYGEQLPATVGTSDAARAENRRVELEVVR